MAAPSFDAAVASIGGTLGEASGATTAAFLVVLHEHVLAESWFPREPLGAKELRRHLHMIAIQSAQKGEAVEVPWPDSLGIPLAITSYFVPLKFRLSAVLCLGFPADAGNGASRPSRIEPMMRMIAARLTTLQEIEAERRNRDQYDRWFRVSVRQIRALDGERQKFVALANSIGAGVFVADRLGGIRWNSRSLIERFPGEGTQRSWAGQSCKSLCERMGAGAHACGECAVARVLAGGAGISWEFEGPGGEKLRAVAHAIKDVDGRAQEVMVVVESAGVAIASPQSDGEVTPPHSAPEPAIPFPIDPPRSQPRAA